MYERGRGCALLNEGAGLYPIPLALLTNGVESSDRLEERVPPLEGGIDF